jgi:hypothetical protein
MKIPSAWSFRMNAASRLVGRELEHGVGHPSHGPTRGAEDARCRLGVGAVNTTSKFGWTMNRGRGRRRDRGILEALRQTGEGLRNEACLIRLMP